MGVILNETITLPNGLIVTNPYVSIGENDMRVWKRTSGNETVTTKYYHQWSLYHVDEPGNT